MLPWSVIATAGFSGVTSLTHFIKSLIRAAPSSKL